MITGILDRCDALLRGTAVGNAWVATTAQRELARDWVEARDALEAARLRSVAAPHVPA